MIEDPIVAEVHAAREAIFAECGYDLDRFNAHMREVSEQLKREGWTFADRPVVRASTTYTTSQAVESSIVREEPPASAKS
ncbi:MAG TPA: hypothetical protein VGE39_07535 [Prosthecobacter sp.]